MSKSIIKTTKKRNYKQVKLNFLEEQYKIIDTLSKEENISMTQYCMSKLPLTFDPTQFRKRKLKVISRPIKKTDPKLLFFLSNISNNLNQLTKATNKIANFKNLDNEDNELILDNILYELIKINTFIEESNK